MSTTVTPDALLASLDKWGVTWRFYKDRADWLVHNRNFKNTDITPGGFGPLYGVVAHNTASTAQAGMIDYLYRGDAARSLPGPLAHIGILKTGEGVLLGWGTTNHAGPSDPRALRAAKADAAPLTSEIAPTTSGPSDPDAVRVAPYFLGFEACYSTEGPTPEQYRAMVLFTCACLDVMGGPANGYGAGSVLMHREMTTTRSDPQGVARDGKFRRDVAAQLKAGPPANLQEDDMALTPYQTERLNAAVDRILGAVPEGAFLTTRLDGDGKKPRLLDSADGNYLVSLVKSVAEKVGVPVDVDEAAIASGVAEQLLPVVREAIAAEVAKGTSPDAIADAVVASLGSKLSPAQP